MFSVLMSMSSVWIPQLGDVIFFFSLDANLHMTDKYRCLIHKKHNATDENIWSLYISY